MYLQSTSRKLLAIGNGPLRSVYKWNSAWDRKLLFRRHATLANSNVGRYADPTMPPGFKASAAKLKTFVLPSQVRDGPADYAMARSLIEAWRRDGIFQIAMSPKQADLSKKAFVTSKGFFKRPKAEKETCVDSQSYSGYIASGEELTAGVADYSEVFTVTKDLDPTRAEVQERWPCHGPCPWPDTNMKQAMQQLMDTMGDSGEILLQLVQLGLGLPANSLTNYTADGWHHMRILRFPADNDTNGKGKKGRGIGSHTDYGLLVIAAQDDVGGLFVRPPYEAEKFANWEQSSAGLKEDDDKWSYVPPVEGVFTVFPGDMMQYLTGSYLPSTPHKVGLNTRERYAFAYFHEPNFRSVLHPLADIGHSRESREPIHYGTHFTNMFMRNYPERVTTRRILEESRQTLLSSDRLRL